jgi:Cyclin, C-terminal domain
VKLPAQPAILTTYSGYEPENVSSVARQIAQTFASRTPTCFKAVTNKYQTIRYAGVANLGLPEKFPAKTST